jgi:hypothetical protein
MKPMLTLLITQFVCYSLVITNTKLELAERQFVPEAFAPEIATHIDSIDKVYLITFPVSLYDRY